MNSLDAPLTEDLLDRHAPFYWNCYALSKLVGEKQIHTAAVNQGLKAVVLRFFNAYAQEEYTPFRSVVCLFMYRLMRGLPITVYRNYWRVFQHVDDLVRTVANTCERFDGLPRGIGRWRGTRPACVHTYNIAGREYTTVEDMKDKVVALLGGTTSKIEYLDAEMANVVSKRPDISLAEADLGHDPKITLDEGLPGAIEWMRERYCPKT
jgi:dTDP-glucose 4,6-dehydratase